jgi:phytoene desaturase
MARIAIIGSGFSGISAAAYAAQQGNEVHVYEKNATAGGRARQFTTSNGFVFDMGPSWYWMPDVFENFFKDFGTTAQEQYDLVLLKPAFDMIFDGNDKVTIPNNFEELSALFESIEKGASKQLLAFMEEAKLKYEFGIEKLIYQPGISIKEYMSLDVIKGVMSVDFFSSFANHVRKFFKHPKLIALMEFPVLFLGAMPQDTPALYSLMNYAGLNLGTWYPIGGFGKVIESMKSLAEKQGAVFHFNSPIDKIVTDGNKAVGIMLDGKVIPFDAVIASADYNHVEEKLLDTENRNYNKEYWENKTFAPSSLVYYLGLNKKVEGINHHTLFFDEDLDIHAKEIYKNPKWPEKPLFYMCCPSKTDSTVAPADHENIFLLMPIAVGLQDDEATREKYFQLMAERIEKFTGVNINNHLLYKKSYCVTDYINDYNSFKGNAYGLANTLMQTAIFKPKIINKKIKNLFYTGQLTVPGPGVPPSIISGKIATSLLQQYITKKNTSKLK